ncbi:hypothetical protein OAD75_06355 [Gammaproteobacteria bacterium]|nr:hypothetical protein [Gammaproteobacteria bacterium]
MRYEYHNFTENLKAIQNTKDMNLTRELLLSELAKVIDGRPEMVRKALIGCGVSVSERAGKRELVSIVSFSLKELCVRTKMMELILANQLPFIKGSNPLGVTNRNEFMNQAGNNSGNNSSNNSASSSTSSNLISNGLKLFTTIIGINETNKTFKNQKEQRAHEYKLAILNRDTMLATIDANSSSNIGVTESRLGGAGSTFMYVLLGVGALSIIGFAIYSSRKK